MQHHHSAPLPPAFVGTFLLLRFRGESTDKTGFEGGREEGGGVGALVFGSLAAALAVVAMLQGWR